MNIKRATCLGGNEKIPVPSLALVGEAQANLARLDLMRSRK
jgi:hypothetical protein